MIKKHRTALQSKKDDYAFREQLAASPEVEKMHNATCALLCESSTGSKRKKVKKNKKKANKKKKKMTIKKETKTAKNSAKLRKKEL